MEKIEAFLHFGFGTEPRLTMQAEIKENLLWWQKKKLMYTATGYGRRIPTEYMVKYNNRWYRVYCCIYSNIGTLYIGKSNKWLATVDIYR